MDDKMTSMIMPKENLSKKAYNLLSAVTQSPAEELLLNNTAALLQRLNRF